MTGRGMLIGAFFIIAALCLGLFVGERVGEKVAAARIESQAREDAERVAARALGFEEAGLARVIMTPKVGKGD